MKIMSTKSVFRLFILLFCMAAVACTKQGDAPDSLLSNSNAIGRVSDKQVLNVADISHISAQLDKSCLTFIANRAKNQDYTIEKREILKYNTSYYLALSIKTTKGDEFLIYNKLKVDAGKNLLSSNETYSCAGKCTSCAVIFTTLELSCECRNDKGDSSCVLSSE